MECVCVLAVKHPRGMPGLQTDWIPPARSLCFHDSDAALTLSWWLWLWSVRVPMAGCGTCSSGCLAEGGGIHWGGRKKSPNPFTWVSPGVLQPCFLITGVGTSSCWLGQGQFNRSKLIMPDLEVTEMLIKLFPKNPWVRPYVVLWFIFWSLGFYLFLVPSQY